MNWEKIKDILFRWFYKGQLRWDAELEPILERVDIETRKMLFDWLDKNSFCFGAWYSKDEWSERIEPLIYLVTESPRERTDEEKELDLIRLSRMELR